MSKDRVEWQVRLYQSNLNGKENEEYVRILSRGTLTLKELVAIAHEGHGKAMDIETLRAAWNILLRTAHECLMEGYTVSTELGTLTPSVKGAWSQDRMDPEARAQNKATVRYTMSPQLKKAMANPLFRLVNVHGFRVYISGVKPMGTNLEEGRLARGRHIRIEGRMLLMNGELPERGVYFMDALTGEVACHIEAEEVEVIKRTMIMAKVPDDLPDGWYRIRVVSQCTTNNRPMKQAAEYTYGVPFAVGDVEQPAAFTPVEEEDGDGATLEEEVDA